MTVNRYATVDVDNLSVFYDGRVVQDPVVTRGLVDSFFGPIRHENTTVILSNRDGGLTTQFLAEDGWRNMPLVIKRFDRITLATSVAWTGIVSESALDGDAGTIRITGTNLDLSVLEQEIPTKIIEGPEFGLAVDDGSTIPVIFGTVRKMPLLYINDDTVNSAFDYMVGYDEAWSTLLVEAVFRVGGTTGSTISTVLVDPAEYVVSTTDWPGYTTIRFILRQTVTATVEAGATSGFIPILATVTNTVTAYRNPVRVIRELLENTTWGLGKTVDTAAFTTAETAMDVAGPYYVDGCMLAPEPSRNWLTELAMFRGIRLAVDDTGQWYPTVDSAEIAPALFLRDGTGDGERNLLGAGERSFADVNNAVKDANISYRESLTDRGTFRKVKKFSRVINDDFGADRTYQNRFVWQNSTADRILDYLAKRLVLDQQRIHLTTGQSGRDLEPGQLVQVTCERLGLSDAVLEIVAVTESVEKADLECRPWDDGIYDYTASDGLPDDDNDPNTTPPTAATNVSECGNVNSGDGTAAVTICYDMISLETDPALLFRGVFIDYRLDTEIFWTRAYDAATIYGPLGQYWPGFSGTGLEQTVYGLLLDTDYVFRTCTVNSADLESYSAEVPVHTAT